MDGNKIEKTVMTLFEYLKASLSKPLPWGGVGVGFLPWERLGVGVVLLLLLSCARMGQPDGGWYDDTPPYVLSASPEEQAVGVKDKKITINFSEFIRLEDAQNKVVVSPPQIEMPEIKASGKRIIVSLKDSLKQNTTYTVDFSDAISDNNEGNPMGNYTYTFSTGDHVDTLQVSGYCLDASNLEPLKGILVGLYDNFSDTIFHHEPMIRVSRTNGSGRFTIKGVAPGNYRIYALKDADGDFLFNQKSEMVGYLRDTITPSWKPDVRPDTIWRDSLHIDNILLKPYTHFLPDDVTLLCFQEPQTNRYLIKTERKDPDRIGFFFSYGNDSLPVIRGLNFPADSAFVLEASEKNDTLVYWLADTTLVNQDTLRMEVDYLMTDTLGVLVHQVDTIEALAKVSYEKRMKERQKAIEKWEKEQEKKKKHDEPYDTIMPMEPLKPKVSVSGQMDPLERLTIEMPEPLTRCDTSAVHLYCMVDSVWYRVPHTVVQHAIRLYELKADYIFGTEYSLEIDSAAFQGLYGKVNAPIKQGFKVRTADEFGTLIVQVSAASADSVVVQILDASDKVLQQTVTNAAHEAEFLYLKPGEYYMRAFADLNGNGLWDTGVYDEDRQAEPVYYYNEVIAVKAKWDLTRQWNLTSVPRHKQKPEKITKQKPDKQKRLKNRNIERAKSLGIQYIKKQ